MERATTTARSWMHLGACALLLVACSSRNPNYCPGANANNNCAEDAGSDGPQACASNAECAAPTPVCDVTGAKTCVQCTADEAAACTGAMPVCGDDQACRACAAHAECGAETCLPDGACAAETDVAYVAPAGSGSACTKAAPCKTLAAAVSAARPYIKIAAGLIEDAQVTTIDAQAVTILADPGAKLYRTNNGVVLEVRSSGADVAIYDLEIGGGSGSGGHGIELDPAGGSPQLRLTRVKVAGNQGAGIAASGGSLTVTQSTISANQGGGIAVIGVGTSFDIANNFIVYNGLATGPNATQIGGAALLPNASSNRFEYNTVAFNQNDGAIYRAGVTCTGTMVGAGGNLVYQNTEGMTTNDSTQRAGNCQYGNTLALGMDAGELGFRSPLAAPFDFHLTAASPATVLDAGGSCTGVDFDGEPRPAGGGCDLGADEYTP